MHINEQRKIEINGILQYISIRSEKEDAPLLLYLHGGPGDAALPLVLKYNSELEKYFTVIVLEQRGSGKSYYKFNDDTVNIDTFVQDIYTLIKIMLDRFGHKKLYLLGHSWGSVLGLKFITLYPELVYTYIGCGQVVNMKKSSQYAYDFAVKNADKKTLEKLKKIDCSYTGENWIQDLLFVTGLVVKYKGSLYQKSNYNDLIFPFLFSKYYGINDLINRQKGSMQAIQFLWQELMQVNFEDQTSYGVPVIFVEGRYDSHVSSSLAESYYHTIQSEKKLVWFDRSCHFPQWSENKKFNQLVIDLL